MAVRNTIDFGVAEAAMQAAGEELKLRMAHWLADRWYVTCPVESGFMQSTITVVTPNQGPMELVSGGVYTGLSDGGGSGSAVHVVIAAPYSLFVIYGYFAGLTWVPPNPFAQNGIADMMGAFPEIVGVESFAPFRDANGWREIDRSDPGSSSVRGPVPFDPEGRANDAGILPGPGGNRAFG